MSRKKLCTTVYITDDQDSRLKAIHAITKVPVAEYIRLGIDMVLKRLEDEYRPGDVPALDWVRRA